MDEDLPVGEPVDAGPARPPERRALEGRYVRVRPLDPEADATALWDVSHDGSAQADRLWTYMYDPFADQPRCGRGSTACAASSDPLFLTVESRGAGPVGMAAFMNVVPEHRRLEIGHIWYAPSAQRTEANTEAAYLMMREAFDELGYRRVEWKCDALNERSRAAALRLGFTFEGVFRQHMIVRGGTATARGSRCSTSSGPRPATRSSAGSTSDPERRPSLASLRGEER